MSKVMDLVHKENLFFNTHLLGIGEEFNEEIFKAVTTKRKKFVATGVRDGYDSFPYTPEQARALNIIRKTRIH